jgi:hypothetical protein
VAAGASAASWTYKSFQWLADESDAVLASTAGVRDAATSSFGTTHDIPSVVDCQACHARGGDGVLGFDALQLSPDVDPLVLPDGQRTAADLDLDDLAAEGLVTHVPAGDPRIRATTPTGRWVMGMLHSNCGNCHNPQGAGSTTTLYLRHETSAMREADEPAYHSTVNQLTTQYTIPGAALGIDSYRILGGAADKSAVFFRMDSRVVGDQMPPMGTKVGDAEALNRLREWIGSLPRK